MARHKRAYRGERYTEVLSVKVTPSERVALEQEAAARHLLLSQLARVKLTDARLPKASLEGVDPATARALVAQLAHLGNNLNQLAHRANETGEIRSAAAVEAATAAIIDAVKVVTQQA